MNYRQSGQALLLAVFIAMLLFLTVPAIVFVNQMSVQHQMMSQKRSKGMNLAEEGVSYAVKLLSPSGNWTQAFGVNPWTGNLAECNGTTDIAGPNGGFFRIACIQPPSAQYTDLQSYQIGVLATAYILGANKGPGNVRMPVRSVLAYLSRKTAGASLGTGVTVSAALQLADVPVLPTSGGGLIVHWGPIVVYSDTPWMLVDPQNSFSSVRGFPRKFSNGPITGLGAIATSPYYRTPDQGTLWGTAETTDFREYWSYAGLQFPPVIDTATYRSRANSDTSFTLGPPSSTGVGTVYQNTPYTNSAHFNSPAGEATLLNNSFVTTYTLNQSNKVIYIDGDAALSSDFVLDLAGTGLDKSGALIINGNLTLGTPAPSVMGTFADVHVSSTAWREYSYLPGYSWPCKAQNGATCTPTSALSTYGGNQGFHFRGFLYVAKDLIVNSGTNLWNFDGTVIVGDLSDTTLHTLNVTGGGVRVFFDDEINRSILTTQNELQVDSMREVHTP